MLKIKSNHVLCVLLGCFFAAQVSAATLLEHVESESGTLLAGYSGRVTSPFSGVAAYGNKDGVEHTTNKFTNVPGIFRIDVRGASSSSSAAGMAIYVDAKKIGSVSFSGTTPTVSSVEFKLESSGASPKIRFVLETDTGANDTYLDWYELHYVGVIPPPPPPPVLPVTGAYYSGAYRNLFIEAGYSQANITAKLNAAYTQLFHSSNKALEGEAIFIEMPNDPSMAYIWDTGNNDVRSEGLSYGMMTAVQMNRQEDFNKLWKWANQYALNKSGDMKGYFAWQTSTSGAILDKNPAPDGEEYFVTALFFASHRWGDGAGIFNYRAQANKLLDDMFNNGQTRYANGGQIEYFSLFDHKVKQVVFSPATPSDRNWTDPSYHLPAFYELWAMWADRNNSFWADLAVTSRAFFKTTVHPTTGLSPDYAYFDGRPHGEFQHWKDTFQYDAWRTISNASMDYAWFKKDEWAVTYAERLQTFFTSKGVESYGALYELNGDPYENNKDHSPGLVAMNAIGSLASRNAQSWAFVQDLWNMPIPRGKYRYYDGSLYMFGMLAASGNYKVYCPGGVVCNSGGQTSSSSSSVASSKASSSTVSSQSSAISSSSRSSVSSSAVSSRSSSLSSRSSSISSSSRSSFLSSVASSSVASSSAGNISAFTQMEVENYNAASGAGITKVAGDGGTVVNFANSTDWVSIPNVNFGTTGASNVNVRSTYSGYGASIQIRLDSQTGQQIATVYPNGGGVYTTAANSVYPKPTGVHTIYVKVSNSGVKINWLKFLP